ncbi:MAG: phosphonate ABC transporter substrate-binding protein [Paracoccaceae bacterium]|nr:phosphonate ABC transporter substrate-binding protein [Paracoccaceae bacterium]
MKLLTTTALALFVATPVLADWREDYQVVRFGILSGENEADRIARNQPLADYLSRELGVEVEIFTAGNYDGVIQAMAADQIEIARFGSSSYAAAYTATNGGVTPFLSVVKADGNTGYTSIVVARCDSGIESLDDAAGKVHAFADPDSTSGFAVPFFNMKTRLDIEPESYFAATPFSGSHEAGVQGVVNGTFDTASTYQNSEIDGIPQRMVAKGMIDAGEVCTVWKSPEITVGPWTARSNLPPEMIEDIKTAILEMPEKDLNAFHQHTSFDPDDANPDVGYFEVDHSRYEWIVDMREWIRNERRSGS